jgi:hypothetical protein
MKVEKTHYGSWEHCYRVSNDDVDLVMLAEAGPRILRYGFAGGQNFLREWADKRGTATLQTPDGEWRIIGGHRIWVAPEYSPGTYPADNDPVDIQAQEDGFVATAPVEKLTRLQKQIKVKMLPRGSRTEIIHRIFNRGYAAVRIAPWALTVMAQDGLGVTGFPPRGKHPDILPPTNPLIMWAFSDFTDPRLKLTKKYLALRQDRATAAPQKFGHFNPRTWGAYLLNGEAFMKRLDCDPAKTYPDFGASFEIFTNADFLELETLGPLETVEPGGSITHVEHWSAARNIRLEAISDEALDRALASLE